MSYMWPSFVPVAHEDHYALYLYREAVPDRTAPLERLLGRPVLFLPGQAGSYRQVRSFGTASFKLEQERPGAAVDWFALDLADEWSALSGVLLERQLAFAHRCIDRILRLYDHLPLARRPRSVPLVGHSMGGVLARAVAANDAAARVGTVLALHSPLRPAALVHASVLQFYAALERDWCARRVALQRVAFVSLGGGLRDALVRSDLAALPPCAASASAYATVLPSIPGIQRSADHQCGVWCLEVALRVAAAFADLVPLLDATDSAADAERRVAVLKAHLGTAPLLAGVPVAPADASADAVRAPVWLKTSDAVAVRLDGNGTLALITTSTSARVVGAHAPVLLPARDGIDVSRTPRLVLARGEGAVQVRGSSVGVTLATTVSLDAAAIVSVALLGERVLPVTDFVTRFVLVNCAPSLALVAAVRESCAPRFLSRAVWFNDDAALEEQYFVGLRDDADSSAVRFFTGSPERELLVVADTNCVASVAVRVDWPATVGHALRFHWQLLYTTTVAVAVVGASLSAHRAYILLGTVGVGAALALSGHSGADGWAAFVVVVAAFGVESLCERLVRWLVQPLLSLPLWLLVRATPRALPALAVVAVALALVDAAAAVALAVLALAASTRLRSIERADRVLLLNLLLLPILATSTVVRIHAFTEHIPQWDSGATSFALVGVPLVLFAFATAAGGSTQMAALGVVAGLCLCAAALRSLADALLVVAAWAAIGTAVWLVTTRRTVKAKES